MLRPFLSLLCALLVLPAMAAPRVLEPYIRALPPGTSTTAIYLTLVNEGERSLKLVAASTPIAARTELHTHTMEEGVARMRQVPSILILPFSQIALAPGGLHIMVFDLKVAPKIGESVPLTLTFDDGSVVEIEVPVRDMRPMMDHQTGVHSHKE